ncbi:MAG: Tyrosine recombinase XerC [bacterium]|nr:Tyrosine recombinase XerC [bacterium]
MAHLRKVGSGYQLQYYLNGRKRVKQFSKGTPLAVVTAEKKRIESEIALHKAGLKRFGENPQAAEFLTLADMTEQVLAAKRHEVAPETIARNRYAMQLFMQVVGTHLLVSEVKPTNFDRFKNARFEAVVRFYGERGWPLNEDKIKRGINKELENIRTVFFTATKKGIIPSHFLPRIERLKVDRKRLPTFLNKLEVNDMAAHLSGEALLAFWIIRYTGARRSEIARKFLGDERGLKWRHIDWTRNTIRLYAKKKERLVPMHPKLRQLLWERKEALAGEWNPEAHVIGLVRDTLSDCFAKARVKAGITKPGAVHILRHTAATDLLSSGGNIREAQEFLGHSSIAVTEIYTHVVKDRLESAVLRAFD